MPVGTAKCYAHRGRQRLRERLGERDVGMTVPAAPFGRDVIEQLISAPPAVPAPRRGPRARARQARRRPPRDPRGRLVLRRPLPGRPDHARRAHRRGARAGRRRRRALRRRRTAASSRSSPASTTAASSASSSPGDVLTLDCEFERVRGPIGEGQGRATVGGELAAAATLTFAAGAVIGSRRNGHRDLDHRASAPTCPERVMTNDDLATLVDTSDEWIIERTGIRERRIARRRAGALGPRAARCARRRSRRRASSGERHRPVIVATVTPDMAFPVDGGDPRRRARRGRRRRLRPLRRLHGLHVRDRAGLRDARRGPRRAGARRRRRRALEDPRLERPLDAASSSATAPARSCSSGSPDGGFLGFELGADGGGGDTSGSPAAARARFDGSRDATT